MRIWQGTFFSYMIFESFSFMGRMDGFTQTEAAQLFPEENRSKIIYVE